MGRLVVIGIVLAVGCGPSVGVDAPGGEGSGEGDTTGAPASDDGVSSSGADDPDSSGPSPTVCGDGIVGESEACDDGNVDDGDGCDSQCRIPGTELWEVSLPPLSACPRLAALDDGGVAIIGNESLLVNVSIPHVVVVDVDGSVRWSFQGGHGSYDLAMDLVAEPGGFVVVGQSDGTSKESVGWMQRWTADGPMNAEVILGADELGDQISAIERRDAMSYWIVGKDDARGEDALLFRSFDEPPTSATALEPDAFDIQLARAPDDGVYVTTDVALDRVDRDGGVIWSLQYDGDSEALAYALASTTTGDAIVAGTDQGDPDVQWIRRFDPDGTERWRTNVEVGEVPKDQPLFVAVDAANAVVVVGDGFLAKYDGDGVELWQQIWQPPEGRDAKACDVVATSDGSFVIAGTEWLRAYTP